MNYLPVLENAETAKPILLKRVGDISVKAVSLDGDYPFHSHADSDETFLILDGDLDMDRDGYDPIRLKTGDIVTIPKNLRHRTRTNRLSKVLLIGPI